MPSLRGDFPFSGWRSCVGGGVREGVRLQIDDRRGRTGIHDHGADEVASRGIDGRNREMSTIERLAVRNQKRRVSHAIASETQRLVYGLECARRGSSRRP